jgi:hypothetical protein
MALRHKQVLVQSVLFNDSVLEWTKAGLVYWKSLHHKNTLCLALRLCVRRAGSCLSVPFRTYSGLFHEFTVQNGVFSPQRQTQPG